MLLSEEQCCGRVRRRLKSSILVVVVAANVVVGGSSGVVVVVVVEQGSRTRQRQNGRVGMCNEQRKMRKQTRLCVAGQSDHACVSWGIVEGGNEGDWQRTGSAGARLRCKDGWYPDAQAVGCNPSPCLTRCGAAGVASPSSDESPGLAAGWAVGNTTVTLFECWQRLLRAHLRFLGPAVGTCCLMHGAAASQGP